MPLELNKNGNLTYDNFYNPSENYQAFLYGEKVDIGGGTIEKEEIDILEQHPELTRITISGLHQDTFEYFIEKYGNQFQSYIFFQKQNGIRSFTIRSA